MTGLRLESLFSQIEPHIDVPTRDQLLVYTSVGI